MQVKDEKQYIELADRPGIDHLYLLYGHGDSAHAFPSLYLWQDEMGLSLMAKREVYTARIRWKGENVWISPVGTETGKSRCIEELLESGLKSLCYLGEEDTVFLERSFPGVFEIRETPEDSEYIYDCRQMIEMPGKACEKIRNRYRRLEKEHRVTWRLLTPGTQAEAAEVTRQWTRSTDTGEGIEDTLAMERMWKKWQALEMQGVILSLDDVPWAVAAGYPLGNGDFDCFLLKAKENRPGVTDHLRAALAQMAGV